MNKIEWSYWRRLFTNEELSYFYPRYLVSTNLSNVIQQVIDEDKKGEVPLE